MDKVGKDLARPCAQTQLPELALAPSLAAAPFKEEGLDLHRVSDGARCADESRLVREGEGQ
eukprot:9238012-Pyramimonas_sp.AAC.1